MTLSVPGHIQEAQVAQATVRYEWDEWDTGTTESPIDSALNAAVPTLSIRGRLALLAGSAEWLLHRLQPFIDDDPLPLEAAEALWAQVVDWRYAVPWNPFEEDEWIGAVRGPIRRMAMWMREAPHYASETIVEGGGYCAERATMLALYVQPNPDAMRTWLTGALGRLQQISPISDKDPLGEVVPREALDLSLPYRPEDAQELIDRFLQGLDHSDAPDSNGFLATPSEMMAEGFVGQPYRFDLTQDRARRGV